MPGFRSPRTRVALVTPSHNFPSGYTLSLERRLELLRQAETQGGWIIEDDYDSTFCFGTPPVTALQGRYQNNCVIYSGSFSRILPPSLRPGYLVLPEPLISPFQQARRIMSGELSLLPQLALAKFMSTGHFTSYLGKTDNLYQERKHYLHNIVNETLNNILTPVNSSGGMHSVFALAEGYSDQVK